ncbi:MAG: hypothetical protein HY644_08495 [Acidobacteria bacterium]|nr:hypothetical protein [Acidobacteriota bacterium]
MHQIPAIGARFCLLLVFAVVFPSQDEKEKENPRVSLVARTSTVLRDYFREMYAKTFADNLNDNALNRVLDDQIDEFVKRVVQKSRRLEETARQLPQMSDPGQQRQCIRRIRDTAGDLESTLRIWSDWLRPQNKAKKPEPSVPPATIQLLVQQVDLYKKQIDQFLFPQEVAVSVQELQSEGFHGTLKKIQRIAQALDKEN